MYKLGPKLGMDPMELFRMISGKVMPTRAVGAGLARELDSDVSYVTKLTGEVQKEQS